MLAIVLLSLCPPCPGDVSLNDSLAWGVGKQEARLLWQVSVKHEESMRETVSNPWLTNDVAAWEREVRWRQRVWFLVDDVLFCNYPMARKLAALREIKELVGEADYAAGRLPAPMPSYRGLSR